MEPSQKTLCGFLIEDIQHHVAELGELSMNEEPDAEQVEYHRSRIETKITQLKGVLNLGN